MKCTNKNIDKVFQVLKLQMVDENGRGEFDEDSNLLTAVETVIEWIEEEKSVLVKLRKAKTDLKNEV